MPTGWREQLRDYRDRWIIGVAIVLSVLVHIALVILFYSGFLGFAVPPKPKTVDFDLSNLDAKTLDEMAKNQPDRMNFNRLPPTGRPPEKADALGFVDHEGGHPTHLENKPLNESQREIGRHGPAQGPNPGSSHEPGAARGSHLPPMPAIGEGVGEPSDKGELAPSKSSPSKDVLNRSVDQMLSRTGMAPLPGGGGGEDGVNPYNPNVGDPGKSIQISTKEMRYMGYFSHIRDKIYLAWVYPQEAQRGGQQGVVQLHFTIQRSGEVSEATVIHSSGYRLLDEYAVKAVREANFNPIPAEWPDKELRIAAAFHYQLIGSGFVN
jgi:TonB family protein